MNNAIKPIVGMRFEHARVLDTMKFDGKTMQVFEVTRIAQGTVYYRPVYDYGDRIGLGSPQCCPVEQFGKWCKRVTTLAEAQFEAERDRRNRENPKLSDRDAWDIENFLIGM